MYSKIILPTLSLILPSTLAGPDSIRSAIASIAQNTTTATGPRALANTAADVGGYGCWCYIDSNHGKGKGHPVDSLDAECKQLHHNYECLIMDTESEVEGACGVAPWEVAYEKDVSVYIAMFTMDEAALGPACDAANAGNACKQAVCKTEMMFSLRVSGNAITGATDPSFVHDNGFEPMESPSCATHPGTKSEKSCCGAFPMRFPYKTFEGSRACCDDKTFDTSMLKCCDDMTTKFLGTC